MARIFAGELSRVDKEVLDTVRQLPDDFWALAEINLGRNVDWLIIRQAPSDLPVGGQAFSTLIVTEVKRSSSPFDGDFNGPWRRFDNGVWQGIPPSDDDINYYWQAVNEGNTVQQWLWNHQDRYLHEGEARRDRLLDEFKIWPDLLILSPPGTQHRLPRMPPGNFGKVFYSLEQWHAHLLDWRPRTGLALHEADLRELTAILNLHPLENTSGSRALAPPRPGIASFADVAAALARFEARLARLEQAVLGAPPAPSVAADAGTGDAAPPAWPQSAPDIPAAGGPPEEPEATGASDGTLRDATGESQASDALGAAPCDAAPGLAEVVPATLAREAIHDQIVAIVVATAPAPCWYTDVKNHLRRDLRVDAAKSLGISFEALMAEVAASGRIALGEAQSHRYATLSRPASSP